MNKDQILLLIRQAFHEGVNQGMKEISSGGKTWQECKAYYEAQLAKYFPD